MVQSPVDSSASTAAPSTDESETTSSSITENIHSMTVEELWEHYDAAREEKKDLRRTIKEFEQKFEETTGRKMLKSDRKLIEETYAQYKQKKAKLRLIDALFKKQMSVWTSFPSRVTELKETHKNATDTSFHYRISYHPRAFWFKLDQTFFIFTTFSLSDIYFISLLILQLKYSYKFIFDLRIVRFTSRAFPFACIRVRVLLLITRL